MIKNKLFFILLISGILLTKYVCSQNEYRYFSFRTGINHTISKTPDRLVYKFLHTIEGDMPSVPVSTGHVNYIIGGNVGIDYHIDSKTDKTGFVIGINLTNIGSEAKYQSLNSSYTIVEQFRSTSVGFPVYFKYGRNIYRNMMYIMIGLQFNYNLTLTQIQSASWGNEKFVKKLGSGEITKYNILPLAGINYSFLNFQVQYLPKPFVNTSYTTLVDGRKYLPYANLTGKNLYLVTSVNVPLSRWMSMKYWRAEKFRRIFLFSRA